MNPRTHKNIEEQIALLECKRGEALHCGSLATVDGYERRIDELKKKLERK